MQLQKQQVTRQLPQQLMQQVMLRAMGSQHEAAGKGLPAREVRPCAGTDERAKVAGPPLRFFAGGGGGSHSGTHRCLGSLWRVARKRKVLALTGGVAGRPPRAPIPPLSLR